ncbi:unnamed protein product [Rotaria sp. Silwood2]|nr:unnamed protein product [Rotaria sp. Silwood2]CAF2934899.1 unnamed protein product [Rotaria sp. Silwood2]CAF4341188.1 unnamed protein product [Rotaria sp. Silwood2]CAF4415817.1 unnamed protein product [Rotaria sp. Silwood2]
MAYVFNSFIDEDNLNREKFENENDEQNLSWLFIDACTTNILLFFWSKYTICWYGVNLISLIVYTSKQ